MRAAQLDAREAPAGVETLRAVVVRIEVEEMRIVQPLDLIVNASRLRRQYFH